MKPCIYCKTLTANHELIEGKYELYDCDKCDWDATLNQYVVRDAK